MKKKLPTVKALKLKLDGIFSLYIRTRDKGTCYTCGVKKPIKQMQCGHYISRGCNALRFDEQNCHAQCVGCNVFKYGEKTIYAYKLLKEYGEDLLIEFENKRQTIKKFKITELLNLIELYEKKLKELEKGLDK